MTFDYVLIKSSSHRKTKMIIMIMFMIGIHPANAVCTVAASTNGILIFEVNHPMHHVVIFTFFNLSIGKEFIFHGLLMSIYNVNVHRGSKYSSRSLKIIWGNKGIQMERNFVPQNPWYGVGNVAYALPLDFATEKCCKWKSFEECQIWPTITHW